MTEPIPSIAEELEAVAKRIKAEAAVKGGITHDQLYDYVRVLLKGWPPPLTGPVLAELSSSLIAGHLVHGDAVGTEKIRAAVLRSHVSAIIQMMPMAIEHINREIALKAQEEKPN